MLDDGGKTRDPGGESSWVAGVRPTQAPTITAARRTDGTNLDKTSPKGIGADPVFERAAPELRQEAMQLKELVRMATEKVLGVKRMKEDTSRFFSILEGARRKAEPTLIDLMRRGRVDELRQQIQKLAVGAARDAYYTEPAKSPGRTTYTQEQIGDLPRRLILGTERAGEKPTQLVKRLRGIIKKGDTMSLLAMDIDKTPEDLFLTTYCLDRILKDPNLSDLHRMAFRERVLRKKPYGEVANSLKAIDKEDRFKKHADAEKAAAALVDQVMVVLSDVSANDIKTYAEKVDYTKEERPRTGDHKIRSSRPLPGVSELVTTDLDAQEPDDKNGRRQVEKMLRDFHAVAAQNGDTRAARLLAAEMGRFGMRLVIKEFRGKLPRGMHQEDKTRVLLEITQSALQLILEKLYLFDATKSSFTTYAARWIKQHLGETMIPKVLHLVPLNRGLGANFVRYVLASDPEVPAEDVLANIQRRQKQYSAPCYTAALVADIRQGRLGNRGVVWIDAANGEEDDQASAQAHAVLGELSAEAPVCTNELLNFTDEMPPADGHLLKLMAKALETVEEHFTIRLVSHQLGISYQGVKQQLKRILTFIEDPEQADERAFLRLPDKRKFDEWTRQQGWTPKIAAYFLTYCGIDPQNGYRDSSKDIARVLSPEDGKNEELVLKLRKTFTQARRTLVENDIFERVFEADCYHSIQQHLRELRDEGIIPEVA
ncbi:hypothetical protein CO046_04420 [Candidatus Peregrinibacteria bacterium CG_4_9_14_0_2_um_filter_53_11]|nr:MAG: hypothetical protein CO046_04420 [Candidatus Peregrinibacteria bacterium CG_4_9_14_0_2_um_filter_53_11]